MAPLSRIRKLLRLARSKNPHEAASAEAAARALMRAHGLSEEDVLESEVVTEVVDAKRRSDPLDPHREELALVVAMSRGCTAVGNAQGIAIRGTAAAAGEAASLYRDLAEKVERGAEATGKKGSGRSLQEAWVSGFWMGFVGAIGASLRPRKAAERAQDGAPAASNVEVVTASDLAKARAEFRAKAVKASIDSLAEDLGQVVAAEEAASLSQDLVRRAYAAGISFAGTLSIPRWNPPSARPRIRGLLRAVPATWLRNRP
jgi:hypothetical protein